MGAFNYRYFDWSLITGDKEKDEFLQVMQDNFLNQLIFESTQGSNIVDLILTNKCELINLRSGGWRASR